MWVQSLDREDTLKESMAAPSSILAWRIPWTEKPGRLQSIGLQRVGHDWINLAHTLKLIPIYILFSSELSQVGTWNKWINLPFIWRNGVCVHKEGYHGGHSWHISRASIQVSKAQSRDVTQAQRPTHVVTCEEITTIQNWFFQEFQNSSQQWL